MPTSKEKQLVELCKKFIEKNQIICAESIYQSDQILIAAPELVYDVCELLGYYEYPDD